MVRFLYIFIFFLPGCFTARLGLGVHNAAYSGKDVVAQNETTDESQKKSPESKPFHGGIKFAAGLDLGYAFGYISTQDDADGYFTSHDMGILLAGPATELMNNASAKSASSYTLYLTYSRTWGYDKWIMNRSYHRIDSNVHTGGLELRKRLTYGILAKNGSLLAGGIWAFFRMSYVRGQYSNYRTQEKYGTEDQDEDLWTPVPNYSNLKLESEGVAFLVGLQFSGIACCF